MAIVINASLSKKIPLPNQEYSSQQVSITITGEVTDIARVPEEAARLLALAESSVDQKLGISQVVPAHTAGVSTPATSSNQSRPASSLPNSPPHPSPGGRRAPAVISPAQLRFLRQLLDRTPGARERALSEHGVTSIESLTSRAASAIIDQLKSVPQ